MQYTLTVTVPMTGAIYHALSNTKVKGRADARIHKRLFTTLRTDCMNMVDETNGDFKGGTMSLDDDAFNYLKDAINDIIDAGFPGQLAEGYVAIDELIAAQAKAVDDAAKETEKK